MPSQVDSDQQDQNYRPSSPPGTAFPSSIAGEFEGLLDNKLLLLSAPAGYGKTSLLIDLAHNVTCQSAGFRSISLTVIRRDFLAYLIASLAEQFPGVGETSRLQLNRLKSIEQDAESLLVTLTNEIYDQVENDFLLIIDDFHLLDDVPVISALVNRFLELVVENCHILLSSRTLPNLDDVTLMVAREQVAGFNHVELAFVPREVQALYAQNYHQHLSDEAAHEFVESNRGLDHRHGTFQFAGDGACFRRGYVCLSGPPGTRSTA